MDSMETRKCLYGLSEGEAYKMMGKDIEFGVRSVSSKDIVGAGFTLAVGHLILPLIPFKKASKFRAFPKEKNKDKMKGGI